MPDLRQRAPTPVPRGRSTVGFAGDGRKRARVCFLYIAQSHQVLHSISVAVSLARRRPDVEVHVAATNEDSLAYARSVADGLEPAPLTWTLLGPGWLRGIQGGHKAPPKLPMLAANLSFLRSFDVLVTPERTTAVLRPLGFRGTAFVYTQHGAGDRAGPFDKRLSAFDLVFAAGSKQRDRMVAENLVDSSACVVVGYPKFDVVDGMRTCPRPAFARDRPTVLYNPHFVARLSSWPRWGADVLSQFADQTDYNLVFAPHLRLFEGRSSRDVPALAPYVGHPAIHMDLGTRAATDMTYTTLADIYLGDVSSQVYEFVRRPRPCLFLNAHDAGWRDEESYRHWRFGPVADGVDRLFDKIAWARKSHPAYAGEQVESFDYTFDVGEAPASDRAADAIAALLARRA
jgi:hypothetical protein